MNYPNLAAEVKALGYDSEFGIETLAEVAHVTVPLLREIIWGDEELTARESIAIYHALTPYGSYGQYSFDYLFASALSIVPPGKNKTILRRDTLRHLLSRAEGVIPSHWHREGRGKAWHTLSRMDQGEPVTYAAYRAGITLADHIIKSYSGQKPRRGLDARQRAPKQQDAATDTTRNDVEETESTPLSNPIPLNYTTGRGSMSNKIRQEMQNG